MVSLLAWKPTAKRPARRLARAGLALACLLLPALPAWAAPKFETSLDRDTIRFGETATLSMNFQDCSPDGQPSLPPISGLEFGGTGTSTQAMFDGRGFTQTTTYTLELRPTRAGDFTIPALTINLKGARLASRPLKLKVLKASAPQPATGNEAAFVRLLPATNTIYLGQSIPVEVQCYFQDGGGNFQLPQLNANGFIVGALPRDPQQTRVRVGNGMYHLLIFRVAASATKTGNLTLGPATWGLDMGFGGRDLFGRFMQAQRLNVSSDAPEIRVLPVPTTGAPPDFNGAIGSFTLAQCEAGPTTVGVGDPITLKIRIAGSGSFGSVTLPANEQGWREFKTYPPTSKFESSDPLQIDGSKYFEQVISPLNAEIKEIPPFTFSFFDPAAGAFRTLSHPGIALTVRPTAATPQPTVIASGAPQPDAAAQNQEIVHIKPEPGAARAPGPPLLFQPLFLTLQAVAPLAWLGALAWRRQKDKLANNPRLRRRRDVARLVSVGLAGLPRLAAANDAEKFYSTVLGLLREQLGERLDLPAPAITEAVLEECKGLDAPVAPLLRDLFHACDQFRYTPEHTAQELASLIPKVKTALAGLRKMPDAGAGAGAAGKLLQSAGCLLLLLGAAAGARGESVSETFAQANKLYEEGKYSQATAGYDGLLRGGHVSPAIYFNAGNAWFKAGRIGRAIYAYRRAEELAPRDPDIRANLEIARNQAGTSAAALPGNRWTRWVGRFTLNEWTAAASASVALFFLVLTARRISPVFGKSAGGWTVFLAAASVWLLACLAMSVDQRLLEKSSIVLVSEAVARRGPMDESQSAFTAHDGAELMVLSRDGDWLQVSDAAKRIGWLPRKDVALMP
ncbi:MAG: BatD family protein [Verrucomicrobiota bacterium]|jgi:tetratricopeptide (TPR) repeat protein